MKEWQKAKVAALLEVLPKEELLEALSNAEKTNNEYKEKYWTPEEFREARKMIGGG